METQIKETYHDQLSLKDKLQFRESNFKAKMDGIDPFGSNARIEYILKNPHDKKQIIKTIEESLDHKKNYLHDGFAKTLIGDEAKRIYGGIISNFNKSVLRFIEEKGLDAYIEKLKNEDYNFS